MEYNTAKEHKISKIKSTSYHITSGISVKERHTERTGAPVKLVKE